MTEVIDAQSEETREAKREHILIDAGITQIVIRDTSAAANEQIPVEGDFAKLFHGSEIISGLEGDHEKAEIYVTGKLADIAVKALGQGTEIMSEAALWQAARSLIERSRGEIQSLGLLELSASGYTIIEVDQNGDLLGDGITVNPHCGAGSGVNLSRILQKLDIPPDQVDEVLKKYVGEEGQSARSKVHTRADRCGVFSSSATISDKNQGMPVEQALAITIKSEVLKACKKVSHNTDRIYLTGGIFRWQYARECAIDHLKERGISEVIYDGQNLMIQGVDALVQKIEDGNFREPGKTLRKPEVMTDFPSFRELKKKFEEESLYKRLPNHSVQESPENIENTPVKLALDIGSTMAKVVMSDASNGNIYMMESYENHGDTIETIQSIFEDMRSRFSSRLKIAHIGITGSGRQQVQKVLGEIWPKLKEQSRLEVLVENHAHARGSIEEARDRIQELKSVGITEINEKECVLVDVGGEDTKITIVDLEKGDLKKNAMNLKCSAGTGSLMDTLKSLLGINSIQEVCDKAFEALRGYGINATCAVFLMENAQKMRASGYPIEEVLSSCYWAIVENMARTLWSQVKMPPNALVLLHGQTMLSDPLPLAVMHRIQEFNGSKMYGLVPPNAGHRACLGLLKSATPADANDEEPCDLDHLIHQKFSKKTFNCRGKVCEDPNACCTRSAVKSVDEQRDTFRVLLGGCSAIDEYEAKGKKTDRAQDIYREARDLVRGRLPESDDPKRVIIPQSFAGSEHAFLLSQILHELGIPVHVDNVGKEDILKGQPHFKIDTCAPNIGASGQFLRLATAPHGTILVPQIDFLDTNGKSLGKTCTTNQNGMVIAMHFARMENPDAHFTCLDMSLEKMEALELASQLFPQFQAIFEDHERKISEKDFLAAVGSALEKNKMLQSEVADLAASQLEKAIDEGQHVAIALARGYILNPGVYDNNVGRLFRNEGVVTIPSDILDLELSDEFKGMYWRNPHFILTLVQAYKKKELHTIIRHRGLAEQFKRLETGENDEEMRSRLALALVSTFRCGPDSMTLPIVKEMSSDILLLQSDGAIEELAHLSNRVGTALKQLQSEAGETLDDEKEFEFHSLDAFSTDSLNPETDVVYLPTAGDNRFVTAVVRAAGFTCIDNYHDEYDTEAAIKRGRKYAGDEVCAPLAGIFADTLCAVEDFVEKKMENDPRFKGKHRIFVFDAKSEGPCRQGQYYDSHRLLLHQELQGFMGQLGEEGKSFEGIEDMTLRYLIGTEENKYGVGLPDWAFIQAFHAVITHEVLRGMYLKGGAACKNHEEFDQFSEAYKQLNEEIVQLFENIKPNLLLQKLAEKAKGSKAEGVAQYVAYGLYNNNGLRKMIREFRDQWIPKEKPEDSDRKLKIHADGEVYMKLALVEETFRQMLDSIGFNSFTMSYSPLWGFFEYVSEQRVLNKQDEIKIAKSMINFIENQDRKAEIEATIATKEEEIESLKKAVKKLREILTGPLYEAAGLEMPHPMAETLENARTLLPHLKPRGELGPYVGEALTELRNGTDLFVNIIPDGCMVGGGGAILDRAILKEVQSDNADTNKRPRILNILSQDGEIDFETVRRTLLEILGPEQYYQKSKSTRS